MAWVAAKPAKRYVGTSKSDAESIVIATLVPARQSGDIKRKDYVAARIKDF